jgi:hypothetical protein
MKQTFIEKSREEQTKEIQEYFKPYADPNCKICFGVGQRGWMTELRQYLICECVMRNIEIEKKKQESLITKVTEVIN